uniref:Cytochrome c oxidase subunit 2 n=1 Tax=Neuroctenus sp. TaxID=2931907 RepID=A0A8T9VZK7_9HEMI|nr:cytochrome c oxidase subunit II [Neuroctenus sp.]WIL06185.1 cytochrome c oxidase subunit II [Neuroctenus hainanensis]
MATWSNISFQDANSPTMEQLTFFHDHTMMMLTMIMVTITYIMISMTTNKITNRFLLHGQAIELIWTVMPAVVLMFIALPSLRILYMMDEMMNPSMTVKAIGHQWYWSYEYTDFKSIEFDSYMKSEYEPSDYRLLDVDNRVVVPMNTPIRVIATSADVIHSWAVPSLGVKVDATPGRLNQAFMLIKRPGIMFGQCSEICGANHSFMPITIESVPMPNFLSWMNSQ